MIFWLCAAAITAIAVWLLLSPMRASARKESPHPDSPDMRLYRDQLAEVDRDVARGTLDPDEAERLRIEVQRRLLDADRAWTESTSQTDVAPIRSLQVLTVAVPLALVAGGFALYINLGAPGARDFSMADRLALADQMNAERPTQQQAVAAAPDRRVANVDAEFLTLMDQLRAAVADRPDDLEGHILLSQNEAVLGDFNAAAQAQAQVIRLKGDAATAQDFAEHAGMLILAADGIVTPEGEQALVRALELDPGNGVARYYGGLLHAQVGRPDRAFQMWRALLEEGTQNAPWNAPIRDQIVDLAHAAGVNYVPPPVSAPVSTPPSGPSAADVAAAADMSPEERTQMIRGMVEGLSERLATDGGPASDWARLIGALAVLGETARASAVLAEAQQVFAANPGDLALLAQTATEAGLDQ